MTNLLVSILISTNAHWTIVKNEPSDRNCLVLGCKADHSEKRTEEKILYRVVEAEIIFDGATNRTVLESAEIKPWRGREIRVLYSGWDYTKPPPAYIISATNWNFR